MTSTNQLGKTTFRESAPSAVQHVTLFDDPAGRSWVQTFLPIDQSAVKNLERLQLEGVVVLHREPLPVDVVSREAEMDWVHDHLRELAAEHAGEWIAVDGTQLVAVAPDLAALVALAAQAGHPHPFVTVVPGGPDLPFFG